MKATIIFIFTLSFLTVFALPTIFVTGIKSEAIDTAGFLTWNDTINKYDNKIIYSCMHQVAGYKGYQFSPVLDCNKYVALPSGLDENTIFNFSYYRQNGWPGIFGSNGRLECMVQKNFRIKSAVRLLDNSNFMIYSQ